MQLVFFTLERTGITILSCAYLDRREGHQSARAVLSVHLSSPLGHGGMLQSQGAAEGARHVSPSHVQLHALLGGPVGAEGGGELSGRVAVGPHGLQLHTGRQRVIYVISTHGAFQVFFYHGILPITLTKKYAHAITHTFNQQIV